MHITMDWSRSPVNNSVFFLTISLSWYYVYINMFIYRRCERDSSQVRIFLWVANTQWSISEYYNFPISSILASQFESHSRHTVRFTYDWTNERLAKKKRETPTFCAGNANRKAITHKPGYVISDTNLPEILFLIGYCHFLLQRHVLTCPVCRSLKSLTISRCTYRYAGYSRQRCKLYNLSHETCLRTGEARFLGENIFLSDEHHF